jgi:hypothetical protein
MKSPPTFIIILQNGANCIIISNVTYVAILTKLLIHNILDLIIRSQSLAKGAQAK